MPSAPSNRPDRDETPVRDRGDACPGALRLHTADDGALARVRVPAGVLSARQAYALADAAERLGDGALDITSRGNLQLRGLGRGCGGELAAHLDAAGLLPAPAHERVRNVVASPLSGLDGRGHLDVQPLVRELDALLCASERATALSGRFLFALDDGRGDMAGLGADVMLLAEPGGARVRVLLGEQALEVGTQDGARALLLAAEAFLDAADAGGTRAWRVRELPPAYTVSAAELSRRAAAAGVAVLASHGASASDRSGRGADADVGPPARGADAEPATAGAGLPEGPGGPSPARARDGAPSGGPAVADASATAGAGAPAHGPEQGGGTTASASGVVHASGGPTGPWPGPGGEPAIPVPGVVDGPAGAVSLHVGVTLGRMRVAQWRLLARTAETYGTGELRVTPWRGVVLPGVSGALLPALADAGLVTGPDSPWVGVGACTGRPGCAKSLADVRADATARVAAGAGGLPVYWSGCERRCGHPRGAWVDVVATGEGRYDLTAPGVPRHTVPLTELADALAAARSNSTDPTERPTK
ncbi:cobalamin biosynthesis protein CobG [Streptomyces sp. NPDC049597]|uniref:cobalamin biosynthesis protein CobG n=1 Tax=Streptomyces sp. NPDC049597 TaxID=3155276 RepID=UPI003427194B